jgi:hypothetical protein
MKKLILSTLLAFSSLSQAEIIHLYSPTGFLEASFERDRIQNEFMPGGRWLVRTGTVALAPTPDTERVNIYTVVDTCSRTAGFLVYGFTREDTEKKHLFYWDYVNGTGLADRLAKAICAVAARKLVDSK